MGTVDNKLIPFHPVLCNLIAEQGIKVPFSIPGNLALHDLHQPSFLILKLLCKHYNGECLGYQIH